MKNWALSLFIVLFIFNSCLEETIPPVEATFQSIIPIPVSFDELDSTCTIGFNSTIKIVSNVDETLENNLSVFNQQAFILLGYQFEIEGSSTSLIKIKVGGDIPEIGQEGYKINIEVNEILIEANTNTGVFYGLQTLMQLLVTNQIEGALKSNIPTGIIIDHPRFEYRGFMLDVVRHFLTVDEVKKFIDVIALYKINHLHLHLTDDQGWRIEIESWPNLTAIGGQSEVGGQPSGFYTKADYQEIIQYAQDRFITIVPEIDMPGHVNAALNAYPELTCFDNAPPVYTGTGVGFSFLCTDKPIVTQFMKDVIREVAEITPGPYFHIGADEVFLLPKWKFKKFVDAAQLEVELYGKKMIGWNESVEATLSPDDIIQFWKNDLAYQAKHAADANAKLIMSPWYHAYLGAYENDNNIDITDILYQGKLATNLKQAYQWNPAAYINGVHEDDIMGIETCIWSEFADLVEDFEALVYPRLQGHAEIGWSIQANKDWNNYRNRLNNHQVILDKYSINYHLSPYLDWE